MAKQAPAWPLDGAQRQPAYTWWNNGQVHAMLLGCTANAQKGWRCRRHGAAAWLRPRLAAFTQPPCRLMAPRRTRRPSVHTHTHARTRYKNGSPQRGVGHLCNMSHGCPSQPHPPGGGGGASVGWARLPPFVSMPGHYPRACPPSFLFLPQRMRPCPGTSRTQDAPRGGGACTARLRAPTPLGEAPNRIFRKTCCTGELCSCKLGRAIPATLQKHSTFSPLARPLLPPQTTRTP